MAGAAVCRTIVSLRIRAGQRQLLVGRRGGIHRSSSGYVNDIPGSRYYARHVVGRFSRLDNLAGMLDPFHAAQFYVDSPQPRQLMKLLSEIDVELLKQSR